MLALNSNFTLENMNIKKIKALHYCLKNSKLSKISRATCKFNYNQIANF